MTRPLLIDCGVVDDADFESSGFSADQFSCLFEHLDSEALNDFLSIASDPAATPDLSSAAELFAALGECGLDLQTLIENSEPVFVDPSHAAGQRDLVAPLARAAKAIGAHGVMIEVHPEPEKALSDGPQALYFAQFEKLMGDLLA